MAHLVSASLARNWYWANNGKCGTLPVAGQTSVMGHTLAADGALDATALGVIDGVARWELRTTVPYGDWFALASAGTLSGAGSPRCSGAYAYGSSQNEAVVLQLACLAAPADLTVVLVYGNGFAKTHARSFTLAGPPPTVAGPPALPPPPPSAPPLLAPVMLTGGDIPPPAASASARDDGVLPAAVAGGASGGLVLVLVAVLLWCARRARRPAQVPPRSALAGAGGAPNATALSCDEASAG